MSEDAKSWEVPGRAHLLGVCGVGMAGLARLLVRRGWCVSGCDAHPGALAAWLREGGVPVEAGHSPAHVAGAAAPDCVIATPAVRPDEPERAAAAALGLRVACRGEVLAALVSAGHGGVAVCGTHGKTTTSCFTARLLQELGAEPEWCIGGATRLLGAVAGGGRGPLVAEADESDGTLGLYRPAVTVVTNIDRDHLDHFRDEAELEACFARAVRQTRGGVAVCWDDARARRVAGGAAVAPVLAFGTAEGADLRATGIRIGAGGVDFTVALRGGAEFAVTLGVCGAHNVLNALGAAAAALLLGYPAAAVFGALGRACSELPGRRFETVACAGGVRVVCDYAHHPAELRAAVAMALAQRPRRLVAVFQPHRYTRTRALGAEFPAAFEGADEVVLLPVYAAAEEPLEGGGAADLYAEFRARTPERRVRLARGLGEVWEYVRRTLRAGDLLLVAGAGDVVALAGTVRSAVRDGWPARLGDEAFGERLAALDGVSAVCEGELAGWCSYGVGGRARWRVEAEGAAALAAAVRLCDEGGRPWRMVGAGTNAWFSDLGEPGCVLRWAKGAGRGLEVHGEDVQAGCGWPGQALLDRLEREGLSGLEFLEGVPGTLGGWLAMNAGVPGSEVAATVRWIHCLNPDGGSSILSHDELGFAYRRCAGLEGRVAVSCGLRLQAATPEAVRARRAEARARRLPLAGLRTAGSLFRNPAGVAAGRLLDEAGCKGLRVGGACVTEFHANIVAAGAGATASDVLALAQLMRARVERGCGVTLVPEVSGLGGE